MLEKSYAEIQQDLKSRDRSGLVAFPVTVLRNVVTEPIEPYLQWLGAEAGLRVDVSFGEFDNIVQEAVGGAPHLLGADTGCVLVHLRLEGISPALASGFTGLGSEEVAAERGRIEDQVRAVLAGIRRQTRALILWHGFETPLHPAYGIVDAHQAEGQVATVARLNLAVRDALAEHANAYFVDLDLCRGRIGGKAFYDARYWHIGRAPYTREALKEIALEDMKYVRALRGRNKKCLVLDCDNTLWGGIIGEDGLAGIKLGSVHPGSPYQEFQREIVSLARRGIIVALCSKNNEEDVWEVFDRHPDMVLRRDDVAAWRINWQDKASNLRELAAELNIGLDHMVFVDDSEFEVNLVREMVPDVEVLHLPVAEAVHKRDRLAACGLFDTLTVADEDRQRNAMYRAEAGRRRLQSEITDLSAYLASLEMEVEVRFADALSTPRVAQLTQKTNQFNLTTIRYSEADIQAAQSGPDADVLSLRLRDRFGDTGLVGVALLRYEGDRARLDSLLMSCRVLGRNVEDLFLEQCLALARVRGASEVVGEYRPTPKNRMVARFFPERDFQPEERDGEVERWVFRLDGWEPRAFGQFKAVHTDVPVADRVGTEHGERRG
ncbi:MAG: HAD-IIIC family phosphatase [Gemmatimonadota bacterium]|nr:HAD family hydrolase [Gemmatimonadota bacterium]